MWDKNIDVIPSRLNQDAPIWRGCSMSELIWLSIACLGVGCPLFSLLSLLVLGHFLFGMAFGIVGAIGFVYLTTGLLQKFKQGKPRGYVSQLIFYKLEQYGLYQSKLLRRSSRWIVGRK